jgi:hypothetical protein
MILSIWKPIYHKSKVIRHDLIDIENGIDENIRSKKGTTAYKVFWTCDDPNCRTPTLVHSISNHHLIKPKMNHGLQICRPCQCTGEGNGRWGDRRTWDDLHPPEKVVELKKQKSELFKKEGTPIKKITKPKRLVDTVYIDEVVTGRGFKLIEVLELRGKHSKCLIECSNGHISERTYVAFRANKKFNCIKCYHNTLTIDMSKERLQELKTYSRCVRTLTSKTYKEFKHIINPLDLPNNRYTYHIDHKFSVRDGFEYNVDPIIMSSKENLEMLFYKDNLNKNKKSSITLSELLLKTEYLLNEIDKKNDE